MPCIGYIECESEDFKHNLPCNFTFGSPEWFGAEVGFGLAGDFLFIGS